ncbi:MAG: hypothetical protein QME49_00830 [bacterium]|nr:hypothetical protein [bacterium]
MMRKILWLTIIISSVSFTTFTTPCFAGIMDDLKAFKEAEKLKQENEGLRQENASLKQQLTNVRNAKKVSYQNIAQTKYRTMVSLSGNYLIDGDKEGANLSPSWYELDFHYSRLIDKVIVYLISGEIGERNIDLSFYYYDPVNQRWESLKTINNDGKNIVTLTFNPLTTSRLKVCPAINSLKPSVLPIAEIEVFGWVMEE